MDEHKNCNEWQSKVRLSLNLVSVAVLILTLTIAVMFLQVQGCSPTKAPEPAPIVSCGEVALGKKVETACEGSTTKRVQVCTERGLEEIVKCPDPNDGGGGGGNGAPTKWLGETEIDNAILADLTSADEDDAANYRYLVSTNLYDEAVADGAVYDVAQVEAAVGKAVYSVSVERQIYEPVAVDAEKTVWRIDIEELGINAVEWNLIAQNDPVRIVSQTSKAKLARVLAKSGNDPVWFHSDNFAEIVHKAPVYHALTDVSATLNQFVAKLGVNFAADLAGLDADFGCFAGSVISASRGTRLVGRFDSNDGNFWITFDPLALDAQQKRSCQKNPLLAQTGSQAVFEFAASEVIYTLPNGLQGYALFAANGTRQDAAPLTIVADNQAPVGVGPEIKNGISCQRCHAGGILPFKDQVRQVVEQNGGGFNANDQRRILELFARSADMDNEIRVHNSQFQDAAGAAGFDTTKSDPISKWHDQFLLDWACTRAGARVFRTCQELRNAVRLSTAAQQAIGQVENDGTLVTQEQFLGVLQQLIKDARWFEDPIN